LDVDSDDDSDISSELSAQPFDAGTVDGHCPISPKIGLAVSTMPRGSPLAEYSSPTQHNNLPLPPATMTRSHYQQQLSPQEGMISISAPPNHAIFQEKPLPPTPETTPTSAAGPRSPYDTKNNGSSSPDITGTKEALRNAPVLDIPDPVPSNDTSPSTHDDDEANRLSVHLPFILAFDSEVLAQQFTLIEKDALNEIDWKELIEMRWKRSAETHSQGPGGQGQNGGINARSWVSFLRDTDARGVEVVIARFNIMVKWAISEIVLTQDLEERARCVIKLIHVAAHCRRLRNFATLAQLAIALTSNEVGRLGRTWALVPAADQRVMRELEGLISPTRNFWALRAEMEGGVVYCADDDDDGGRERGAAGRLLSPGGGAEPAGCIPFVGIYTHDLVYNAQRPSEIASSPSTGPLVNFERCRTAAGVVKTLLRLLEASQLYTFAPIEGITERCLWMGALTDEEIRRRGEGLE